MSDEYESGDAALRALAELRATVDQLIADQKRHLLSAPEPAAAAEPWPRALAGASLGRSGRPPPSRRSGAGIGARPRGRVAARRGPAGRADARRRPGRPPGDEVGRDGPPLGGRRRHPRKRLDALARRLDGRLRPGASRRSAAPAAPFAPDRVTRLRSGTTTCRPQSGLCYGSTLHRAPPPRAGPRTRHLPPGTTRKSPHARDRRRAAATGRLVPVPLRGEGLAVRLESVAEVIWVERLTRFPLAPPQVLGLCTLRRDVIPVVLLDDVARSLRQAPDGKLVVLVLQTSPEGRGA